MSNAANKCNVYMRITDGSGFTTINDDLFPISNDFQFERFAFDFKPFFDASVRQDFIVSCSDANFFPIVQLDALDVRRKGS